MGILPALTAVWRQRRPGVALRPSEHGHPDLVEASVRAGHADVGLGPAPAGPMAEVIDVGFEEFCFVLPADHPAHADGRVDPRDLAKVPWVQIGRASCRERVLRLV